MPREAYEIGESAEWSEDQLEEILERGLYSLKYFCKAFMPDTYYRPFSKMHDQIFEILDDDSIQKVGIAAPRGIGKTSIVDITFPLHRILYGKSHYIVPVSATGDAAVEQSENLKFELMSNEDIMCVPGWESFKPEERADPFGAKEWVTSTHVKVRPRGAGQQVRGRLYRRRRPDCFVIDDLEDDEGVMSEDQRAKLKAWFFSALVNSVDRGSKDWRIAMIGTVLHEDSLLIALLNDPTWTTIRLEICNDLYQSAWPEFITDEEIQEIAKGYREQGDLGIFYREYRNLPVANEERGFKTEYFQDYSEKYTERELNDNNDIETVILFDPAKTHTKGSANTAIAGVSVNTKSNEIFVRDMIVGKFFPDEVFDEVFLMAERLNAIVIAPEVTSLNEYLTYPLQTEMTRRGLHYVIIEVKPREGKTGPKRSGGLVPFYRQGLVWHNARVCGSLERNLFSWPRPEKWDEIDAVSGLISVLDEGERFFLPKDYDNDDPEVIEAEFEELDYEPALTHEELIRW